MVIFLIDNSLKKMKKHIRLEMQLFEKVVSFSLTQ